MCSFYHSSLSSLYPSHFLHVAAAFILFLPCSKFLIPPLTSFSRLASLLPCSIHVSCFLFSFTPPFLIYFLLSLATTSSLLLSSSHAYPQQFVDLIPHFFLIPLSFSYESTLYLTLRNICLIPVSTHLFYVRQAERKAEELLPIQSVLDLTSEKSIKSKRTPTLLESLNV